MKHASQEQLHFQAKSMPFPEYRVSMHYQKLQNHNMGPFLNYPIDISPYS